MLIPLLLASFILVIVSSGAQNEKGRINFNLQIRSLIFTSIKDADGNSCNYTESKPNYQCHMNLRICLASYNKESPGKFVTPSFEQTCLGNGSNAHRMWDIMATSKKGTEVIQWDKDFYEIYFRHKQIWYEQDAYGTRFPVADAIQFPIDNFDSKKEHLVLHAEFGFRERKRTSDHPGWVDGRSILAKWNITYFIRKDFSPLYSSTPERESLSYAQSQPGQQKEADHYFFYYRQWTSCQHGFYGCKCTKFCLNTDQYVCDVYTGDRKCNENYWYNPPNCSTYCNPKDDPDGGCTINGDFVCQKGLKPKKIETKRDDKRTRHKCVVIKNAQEDEMQIT